MNEINKEKTEDDAGAGREDDRGEADLDKDKEEDKKDV